jgi:hypothetical protein
MTNSVNAALNCMGELTDPEIVSVFKKARNVFSWEDLPLVKIYNELELRYGSEMQTDLCQIFVAAGYPISSWHGPGALARFALRQHKIENNMAICPPDVWLAARYAYSGGRFEQFLAGYHPGEVWNADINSAYPYAISLLPDLATAKWKRLAHKDIVRRNIEPTQFAIYHIRYHSPATKRPMPLFRRDSDGSIRWPNRVEGWYWAPEAANVADDPYAEFLECWVCVDDGTRPFHWVNLLYQQRLRLKEKGDPTELAIKLMLNSIYGQLAMRAGWKIYRKQTGGRPPYHQLEWAGFITSYCKAKVYQVAKWAYERKSLVSIDTDGIYATVDLSGVIPGSEQSNKLGDWKIEQYKGIVAWQSGFYWLRNAKGWMKAKSRGVPKGTMPIEAAWEALRDLTPITRMRKTFVGYGLALRGQFDDWRTWRVKPFKVEFAGDGGKRNHNPLLCEKCAGHAIDLSAGLHGTTPDNGMPNLKMDVPKSCMHYLPWADVNNAADHQPPEEFLFDFDYADADL